MISKTDSGIDIVKKVTYVCLIGASLSKPHTSVTALAEVVCMFEAIYRMSVFKYFMKLG